MKRMTFRHTPRQLFGLTLTLVGLLSWNTLPVHLSARAVQAATRARVTKPTAPPVSRAAANGRVAFVSSEGNARSDIYTMEADGSNVQRLTNVSRAAGHSSVAFTLDTYHHVLPAMRKDAADRIGALLFGTIHLQV